jgi:hypothetical protein
MLRSPVLLDGFTLGLAQGSRDSDPEDIGGGGSAPLVPSPSMWNFGVLTRSRFRCTVPTGARWVPAGSVRRSGARIMYP